LRIIPLLLPLSDLLYHSSQFKLKYKNAKTELVYIVISVKFRKNSAKQVNLPVNGGKGSTAQWLKGVRDVKVLNGL